MFRFKHFSVEDSLSAMKIGTDGVLLGVWADVAQAHHILDAGTGTGLIALMAAQRLLPSAATFMPSAQRSTQARIVAIDIVEAAAEEARSNVAMSQWRERIEVVQHDLRTFDCDTKFDHIVSNPPFFSEPQLPSDLARSVARHTTTLEYDDIVSLAERLLIEGGKLSVILPFDCGARMRSVAFGRLWLSRQTDVITTEGDKPRRVLMEFTLQEQPMMPRCDKLTIRDAKEYTQKYRQLTEEFYLMF